MLHIKLNIHISSHLLRSPIIRPFLAPDLQVKTFPLLYRSILVILYTIFYLIRKFPTSKWKNWWFKFFDPFQILKKALLSMLLYIFANCTYYVLFGSKTLVYCLICSLNYKYNFFFLLTNFYETPIIPIQGRECPRGRDIFVTKNYCARDISRGLMSRPSWLRDQVVHKTNEEPFINECGVTNP